MEPGKYYHYFNRTINREYLFKEEENYRYFLSLMKKYLPPVADVYEDLQGFQNIEGLVGKLSRSLETHCSGSGLEIMKQLVSCK